jgi:hypothetical protein
MSDDWRLHVELQEEGLGHRVTNRLEASELEHGLESKFHDRVVVTRDSANVFCYTGTREQAEAAADLIASLAAEHGWKLQSELQRWHPSAERWEDPDKPLPESDAERAAERAELMAEERRSAAEGNPEFEVRIECASADDAERLTDKLRAEGLPCVQRHKYVIIGASDEDSAKALAERLRGEAPPGSTVAVLGTPGGVQSASGGNPFAIFGGLAG